MASTSSDTRNIFYQIKKVFGCLDDKKLPYMDSFWRAFKLWGEPINTWEQQDAYEFFVDLIGQLDEYLTVSTRKAMKNQFKHVQQYISCEGDFQCLLCTCARMLKIFSLLDHRGKASVVSIVDSRTHMDSLYHKSQQVSFVAMQGLKMLSL